MVSNITLGLFKAFYLEGKIVIHQISQRMYSYNYNTCQKRRCAILGEFNATENGLPWKNKS